MVDTITACSNADLLILLIIIIIIVDKLEIPN